MKKIGMVIPTADNSFFANLAVEVEKIMFDKGYVTFIASSANDAEKEKAYLKTLADTDGIICVSGLSSLPEDLIPENFPLVWVDRVPESERTIPWVANDDAQAMEEATKYLISKGCKNIVLAPGYIAEHQENPRVRGYQKALMDNGIEFRDEFILDRKGEKSSEKETEELVQALMHKGYRVDGIITSSDRAAFGAVEALKKTGYYVPEDVRLISFDNSPYTAMSSITTIDRNAKALAEKACEVLIHCIDKEQTETKNMIRVSLVERGSTK